MKSELSIITLKLKPVSRKDTESDHIFVIHSIVNKIVRNEKRKLFAAFIDFKKAFDRVNRDLLLLKLQRLGIKGLLYKNIKEMYHSVSIAIR